MRRLTSAGGLLLAGLALANGASAQVASDTLTLSRDEALGRAIAAAADLEQFRAAARAASALTRVPTLVSSPVLTIETEGSPGPFSGSDYTRRVGLDQEIDLRGQRGARRRVGQASLAVAEHDLSSREQAIRAAVDEAYGRWLVARRRVALVGPLLERAAELSSRADAARRREIITGFDARVLKGDVAELEAEQMDALRDLDLAAAELRVWLGLSEPQALRLDDDLDALRWSCSVASLTVLAQRSRADLARAGAAESLAASRVGLERRLTLANPTLGVSAARESRSFDSLAGELADRATIVGIHASIPLPWSRPPASVNEAQLELIRARAERVALDRTIRQEVAAACAAMGRSEDRRELFRIAGTSAASDLRLTEMAYREGRIPLEQYLTVRERLVRIQREALAAVAEVEAARIRLVRATGLRRDILAATLSPTER